MKTLIIDIDGVACEHAKAICDWINRRFNLDSKTEDITTWDHDFGPITFCDAVRTCYPAQEFILHMEVTPDFPEFLRQAQQIAEIKFASARHCSHEATRLWVRKNLGKFETLFVESKAKVSFDYLMDDCPEEALKAADLGKVAFLISRPWNNDKDTRSKLAKVGNIHVVKSFEDILDFLKKYTSQNSIGLLYPENP